MPDPIRSLAELKRTVQVGTTIKCLQHWQDEKTRLDGSPREPLAGTTRTVTKVQTNGYNSTIDGRLNPGTSEPMKFWTGWPKAAAVTFADDGTWTVDYGDGRTAVFQVVDQRDEQALAAAGAVHA